MPKTAATIALLAFPVTLGVLMFQATGDTRGVSTLPPVPVPDDNPITEEKRVLGKALFYDQQLSSDNTVACASCHAHTSGGADPRIAVNPGLDAILGTADDVRGSAGVIAQDEHADYLADPIFGVEQQVTTRAANPVINAAYFGELFWDGRAGPVFTDPVSGEVVLTEHAALESQSVAPPVSAVEMAHADRDWNQIAEKLARARPVALASNLPPDLADAILDARTYPEMFRRAFGDSAVTPARIAMALGTYQRTLISDQTPWDAFIAGDASAMTPAQIRGWQVFQSDNARCADCHTPPLFTDGTYRNIGLRPVAQDAGRQAISGDPADAGSFKTPGLRNTGLKRTFMHTGHLATVELVVLFYAASAQNQDNLDPLADGIQLNAAQRDDLTAFLTGGLTDPRVRDGLFPFDAPDLFTRPGVTPNPVLVTPNGRPDSQGRVPTIIARTPPLIGSDDFKIGLANVAPGATATLVMSAQPPSAGEITPDVVVATVNASTDQDAVATAYWSIPGSPLLDDQVRYFQWRVDDPNQAAPALSRVARATLDCGFGDCATGCPPDLDGNLRLDFFDVATFLTYYNQQDLNADLAEPAGVFNFFDLAAFITAYNAGCP